MGPPPSDDVKIGMFIVPMAVGAAITAMFTTNFGVRESIAAPSPEIYRHLNLFGDVFERVRAEYVEAPDDEALIEKMRLFGEKIGIAFQIRDDLFDFGTEDVGKPLGIDIKEKKMTLPLIYALNQASRSEKRRIINIIKKHNENKEKVNEVIEFVRASGGLEYAQKAMLEYREEAFKILHTLFLFTNMSFFN